MTISNSIVSIFKKHNLRKFKIREYKIGKETHLIYVADAINKFSVLEKSIINTFSKYIDNNIKDEFSKIQGRTDTLGKEKIIECLMIGEKKNRSKLNSIINDFLNRDDFDIILQNCIKCREDAIDLASSLGILDDYIKFLESNQFNGPKINLYYKEN